MLDILASSPAGEIAEEGVRQWPDLRAATFSSSFN